MKIGRIHILKAHIPEILLSLLLICWSCGSRNGSDTDSLNMDSDREVADVTREAAEWADSVMRRMSMSEKIGQLFMPALYSRCDNATLGQLRYYVDSLHVGGIVLLKGDLGAVAAIADTIKSDVGVFIAIDAETGLGMRLEDVPRFPWNSGIDRDVDDQTLFDYGREVARESRLAGINMVLGPVLDVDRERPGNPHGTMWMRSLGNDPDRVAELSVAYARGLEAGGVISVAKHFPGHGATITDTHRGMAKITTGEDELWVIDLEPFRQYVDNGLSGILVGHLWVESIDSVCRPASFSPTVIEGLLRDKMNFKGLVLTDALNMEGACGFEAADAIAAGADIVVAPANTLQAIKTVSEAVNSGIIKTSVIEERCRRVLFFKYLYSLPFTSRTGYGLSPEELRCRVIKGYETISKRLSK